MLDEIQHRDLTLLENQGTLEKTVQVRTAELRAVNTDLVGRARHRRGREPRQERVPRQHEPRDPHADERHHRHDGAGARHRRSTPSSASTSTTVKSSAESLLTIINDILDFSKIEAGKLDAGAGAVRPAPTSSTTRSSRSRCARARRGSSSTADVDAGRAGRCSSATRRGCGRSLVNLVGNAIKFTEQARSWSRVGEAERTGERLRCSTSRSTDTGIGIPADKHGAHLRAVQPGGRVDDAPLRRHGPGPDDLGAAGRS